MAEYRVIARLVLNHGHAVSYRHLYDELKGMPGFIAGPGEDGYRNNMRSAIKRMRRKFTRVDPEWNPIINHSAFGYSWREL